MDDGHNTKSTREHTTASPGTGRKNLLYFHHHTFIFVLINFKFIKVMYHTRLHIESKLKCKKGKKRDG